MGTKKTIQLTEEMYDVLKDEKQRNNETFDELIRRMAVVYYSDELLDITEKMQEEVIQNATQAGDDDE